MNVKRLLIFTLMALSAMSAGAYDFSYTYQGKTLFYTITNSYYYQVSLVNPANGDYYSYVTGDVAIPDSVEYNGIKYAVASIGFEAFANCIDLTSVTIPNSVTSIGGSAFYGCSGLTSVTIGNSVTIIDGHAFYGCSSLTSVTIPNSVTSIGGEAFYNCSGLTSVTIPNSVTSIGGSAFYGCSGLTSVTIPNSVTSIDGYAFYGCSSLTSIVVAEGNTHYDSRDNCNAIIQTDLNLLVQGCNTTVIPSTVTRIGNNAFSCCSGLTSVTIPNSVTTIGNYAFSGCSGLTSVTIPESVTSIGQAAFSGCSGLTSVTIPNSVTSIGDYTFHACRGLTSVNIPDSVTSIGFRAFCSCSGLTSVTIPNSVTNIGNSAFEDCNGLTSVTIPNSVTNIGSEAFYNCSGLTMVIIPSSVISIGYRTFYNCSMLTSVYCKPTTPPTLDSYNFNYSTQFYVHCGSVSAYQSATNWSDYSSRMHGMPFDLDFNYSFLPSDDSVGTVNVGALDCDSNITITAIANTGYLFIGWSDGGTGNPRTLHLTGDTTVTAIFDYITYIVTGQSNNTARGIVTGSDTVYYGDTVTLTATPNYGYHFQRWQDNNTENPRTVVVTQNRTYTAYFLPNSYTVTVHSADSSQGTVNGSGNSNYMSSRTIRAFPATGYHFSHWSDGDSNATRSITVTQDTVLTAFFEINSYTLTVLPNVGTLGTVTGGGSYTHGSMATVTATPTQGNRFDRWDDDNLLASRTITMTSDLQLVAVFVPVDTMFVHDTTILHDTTYVDVPYAVHDTTYINNYIHDTTIVDNWIHDTTYLWQYDTTYIDNYIHDTTIVDNWIYDTTIVVDTLWLNQYDTVWLTLYDTVWLHDTVIIHDTIYITQEGVGDVAESSIKLYQKNGQIVVEGAAGKAVYMYDINGRLLMRRTENEERRTFDVPVSGAYLIKVGELPARKIVVIR